MIQSIISDRRLKGLNFLLICLIILGCSETKKQQKSLVRGVWLTNVDSEVLFSREGIEAAVRQCKTSGFNTIFTVTWNRGYTLYPSKIMKETFGVEIDPKLEGRDPLQELIEIAHAEDIKVFAWFEFGFSSSYQEADGGYLLREKPHWAATDSAGNLVSKNGFQWMNAFDPEVQDFVLSLLLEAIQNYDLDGIQGDDRLPALPSYAGYDSLTVSKYMAEYGQGPPQNYLDSAWVDWRAKLLNQFMKRMYESVKEVDPKISVSVSPSIFPWSKEQYLQDWPTWVAEGWVDMVCPQIYRYDIEKYRNELRKIMEEQVPAEKHDMIFPGVLLKVGDYVAEDDFLQQMVDANRKYGIEGEVFFFYEGVKLRPDFFEKVYE